VPADLRHAILFEPVRIGPVTAKNRFFQTPHCNGMGSSRPEALVRMRAVKAEGGWGVICTEETSIAPEADIAPAVGLQLWDESDLALAGRLADAIHRGGALAGIELMHYGPVAANRATRRVALGPSGLPFPRRLDPAQPRAMDLADIREVRADYVRAARLARQAGFDLVYAAAVHDATLPMHFLSRRYNRRSDEYGGSLENRVRLLREIVEDIKAAIGDRVAIAVRLAVDELLGPAGLTSVGEGREIVAMLAELPDLWDVNLSNWSNDSASSRFAAEGHQEPYVAFVKKLTSKPVVGVGLFTSPDTMADQIRRGVLDLVGMTRPSIADPFLPRKVAEGRVDDIRECIGCNICVASHNSSVPLRCTQNPTAGEEWRRDWHPEVMPFDAPRERVLVVGAGPAGLECALTLARRGFGVVLAEAKRDLGGRVTTESRLPGLTTWARVRDWRLGQMAKHERVEIFRESRMTAADATALDVSRVIVAAGSRWRADGLGRANLDPIPIAPGVRVITPDDVMAGDALEGPVLVFDDDHYYMGGVIAEKLVRDGLAVTLATPNAEVAAWTAYTLEQPWIARHLAKLGVALRTRCNLSRIEPGRAFLSDGSEVAARTVVLVTAREPIDALYRELAATDASRIHRIGDCDAPSTIAAAVYAGHALGRTLGAPPRPSRREA